MTKNPCMELRFHDGNIIPYWNNNTMMESKFHDGIKIACWNLNSNMESKFHYGIKIPLWNQHSKMELSDEWPQSRLFNCKCCSICNIFFVFQKIAISCKGDCKICDLVNNGCNFFFSKKLQIGHLQMKVLTTY